MTKSIKAICAIILLSIALVACQVVSSSAPVSTIVQPKMDAALVVNQSVGIESLSLSQSGIERVDLYVDDVLVQSTEADGAQSFSTIQRWTPTRSGTFQLETRAIDLDGNQSSASPITVLVGEAAARVTLVASTFTPVPQQSQAMDTATPSATPIPATVTPTPTPIVARILTKTDLNVRAGDSSEFDVVGILLSGATARLTGINAERTWWRIEFEGVPDNTGWISADPQYGTAINGETVPVVNSAATPTPTVTPTPTATPTNTPVPLVDYPVIHYFRADKLNISQGTAVLLQWDVSGADELYLYPGGSGGVVSPGDMQVTPDTTTIYRLVAKNARGEVQATVTINVSVVVLPPDTIFNFVDEAYAAEWENSAGVILPWNGETNDPRGFARWLDGEIMEDDSQPDSAIETHPEWTADGYIQGSYPFDFEIKSGDKFVADVGFLKGATFSNGVTFQLCYFTLIDGDCLFELEKDSTGELTPIEVDLSGLNGYNLGWLQLRVTANGNADQDWAVWVNPRIERPANP